jgi:hypothetical protein
MRGKLPPDSPGFVGSQVRLADAQFLHSDSLAVKHAKNVVVGNYQEPGRVGKGLVTGKPPRLGMPVRAQDRCAANLVVKFPCDGPGRGIRRKKAIVMKNSHKAFLLKSMQSEQEATY